MHNFLHIDLRARIYLFTHYIRFFKRGEKTKYLYPAATNVVCILFVTNVAKKKAKNMHKNKTILLTWTYKAEDFLFDKEFWQ